MAFDYNNYYRLEYIESTGTQYINTGVVGPAVWEYDLQVTDLSSRQLMGYSGSTSKYWGFDSGYYTPAIGISTLDEIPLGNRDIYTQYYLPGNTNGYINGKLFIDSSSWPYDDVSILENLMFALHSADEISFFCKMKLWSCKVWSNNDKTDLIRYFIPSQRKSDSVIGLYDEVNGVFYTNAGSGTFVSGGMMVTYNSIFDKIVSTILDKCQNIGSSYKTSVGNITISISRTGSAGPDGRAANNPGAATLTASVPALVSQDTFLSDISSFFRDKGIDVTSTSSITSKQISYMCSIIAEFLNTNLYCGKNLSNNTMLFYYKKTSNSKPYEPVSTSLKIEKKDISNIQKGLENMVLSNARTISLYAGSFTIASSSSVFIAYFNLN